MRNHVECAHCQLSLLLQRGTTAIQISELRRRKDLMNSEPGQLFLNGTRLRRENGSQATKSWILSQMSFFCRGNVRSAKSSMESLIRFSSLPVRHGGRPRGLVVSFYPARRWSRRVEYGTLCWRAAALTLLEADFTACIGACRR